MQQIVETQKELEAENEDLITRHSKSLEKEGKRKKASTKVVSFESTKRRKKEESV